MTQYREILRLLSLHLKRDDIARSCRVSSKTISRTRKRAAELGLSWPLPDGMTEERLAAAMFPPPKETPLSRRHMPDMGYISRRLHRDGLSIKALWEEYLEECRSENARPLMYSGFRSRVQQDQTRRYGALNQTGTEPGRAVTCWIPGAVTVADCITGDAEKAFVFVAAMEGSSFAYAGAFPDMRDACRIRAGIRMLEFFGGVPKVIEQDRHSDKRNDPDNDEEYRRALREFAEHYGTAVLPPEPRRKKGAPESISTALRAAAWLLGEVHGEDFRSLDLLNIRLMEKISVYNSLPVAGNRKSRERIFRDEELPLLSPLPDKPYVFVSRRKVMVQRSGYVTLDYMRYSVPKEYAGQEADVSITDTDVEIFIGGEKAASHKRLYGRKGQYSTVYLHRYKNEEGTENPDAEGLISRAHDTGPCTEKIARSILDSRRTLRNDPMESCRMLLTLSEIYSPSKLEDACRLALVVNDSPGYAAVRDIIRARYSNYFGKGKIWWLRADGE